jgi:hypothetical protein
VSCPGQGFDIRTGQQIDRLAENVMSYHPSLSFTFNDNFDGLARPEITPINLYLTDAKWL